jgi:hypothetical protein
MTTPTMMFVPVVRLLFSATHQSANGFAAVPRLAAHPIRRALALSSTAASDSSSTMWAKLFIDGSNEDLNAFEIDFVPYDIGVLNKVIITKAKKLYNKDVHTLQVFAPGTNPANFSTSLEYQPWLFCSDLPRTTDEDPLIVAAKRRQNLGPVQNGELDYCLHRSVSCFCFDCELNICHLNCEEEKEFNLQHLLKVKKYKSWVDCGEGLVFTGRKAFVTSVRTSVESLLDSPPEDSKSGVALVYSSVSRTGKTVSMLQLKAKLPKDIKGPVVVAYLGFNVDLDLNYGEKDHILRYRNKGVEDVLARRLAGATIISMENPDSITDLPSSEYVYNGYEIPPASKSIEILLDTHGSQADLHSCWSGRGSASEPSKIGYSRSNWEIIPPHSPPVAIRIVQGRSPDCTVGHGHRYGLECRPSDWVEPTTLWK